MVVEKNVPIPERFLTTTICCCEIYCFRINFIITNNNRSSNFLHLSMNLTIMAFTHSFTATVVQMV